MASPSPESQPPTSPPSDDDSSPPPPPDDSQSASPPSSPPPDDPSPPPDHPSPPPEEPASPPPPPPSPSSDSSPPPESSSHPSPPSPKSSSSSPPPPSASSKPSPPPPPRSALAPPKLSSRPTPSSDSTPALENDSSSGTSSVELPTIIGVAVGAGLLLLVMILLCVVCRRKKKKRPDPMSFYGPSDPSIGSRIQNGYAPAGNFYYPNQHPPEASWHGSPAELSIRLRPPPGMPLSPQGNHPPSPGMPPVASAASPHSSWPPPPAPPPYFSSSDMSSSGFSGSHRPGLPPQHPSMALGFTQSSFSYEELAAATRGFSRDNILGEGGFGFVFKGVLSNGKETAIKCLKSGSGQGDREFQAEVEIISRVHHRHLVSLEGYCIAGAQRILVYEFVPNKTLEYHLHGKDRPAMDWATRLKIALGSAKGLAYLHEDCHPRIIHRDIKASNILLDDNFEAKVSDFGLAKLTSDNYTHVSTRVMGTFGYLAPEYASSGKLTEKSDTFSFGVMLLKLITGRRPVDATGELMEDSLVDWARPLIDSALQSGNFRELADPLLEGDFDPQEMARMVACAGACTRHSAKRRPKMSQVARALEGESSLDDLNTWNKQTQSAVFGDSTGSGSSSAAFESGSYAADMKKLRKPPTSGQEYASSEYGATSEYGLNPSSSSSSSGDSQEISSHARRNRMHAA